MIRVWRDDNTEAGKNRLFNKINFGIKEMLNGNLKESIPTAGAKDIAITMMSKKVGKNLYVSPNGRKYRRIAQNGKQKTSKNSLRH